MTFRCSVCDREYYYNWGTCLHCNGEIIEVDDDGGEDVIE
jgi:hypothetical protein